jgi:hypothetical protein
MPTGEIAQGKRSENARALAAPAVRGLLCTINLFGVQVEKEAAAAKRSGIAKNLPLKTAEGSKYDRSGESPAIAAKLAKDAGIPNITSAGMRQIKELRQTA